MLRFLGFVFLAGAVIAAGMFGSWYYHDVQARKFVTRAMPAIYSDWNVAALRQRSVDKLAEDQSFTRDVPQMFYMMKQALGRLQSVEPLDGTMRYRWADELLPRGFIGRYAAPARFERDRARLSMTVIKVDGAWRIASFNVDADAITEAIRNQGRAETARFQPGPEAERQAVAAQLHEILRPLDEGRPGAAWNDASRIFQDRVPKERFIQEYNAVISEAGTRRSRKMGGIGFLTDLPGHPRSEYARARFVATYQRVTLQEELILYKEAGKWSLAYFEVREMKADE